jgi:hypothetical protein
MEPTATGSAGGVGPNHRERRIPDLGFQRSNRGRGADHYVIFNPSWICGELVAKIEAYTRLDLSQRAWLAVWNW